MGKNGKWWLQAALAAALAAGAMACPSNSGGQPKGQANSAQGTGSAGTSGTGSATPSDTGSAGTSGTGSAGSGGSSGQ